MLSSAAIAERKSDVTRVCRGSNGSDAMQLVIAAKPAGKKVKV
jgi:hypothetical protein